MTHIYILYNYELYKLAIKIYMYKYVLIFLVERCLLWLIQNDLFFMFVIIIKIYTINLNF